MHALDNHHFGFGWCCSTHHGFGRCKLFTNNCIFISIQDGELFDWVDIALKEVFDKAANSVKGMEAVFLIENQVCKAMDSHEFFLQFLCCGFNGTSDYENLPLSPGCCEAPTDVCTDVNAHTKVNNDDIGPY